MSTFFVASSRIRDPEKFADYGAKATPTFAPFGGKLVIRGKAEQVLAGKSDHHTVAVVSFPDMDALNAWFQSDAYQRLIPPRDEAVDMALVAFAEPA